MTIQKKELELFYTVLKETLPTLADARIRDAFMKPLGESLETFLKEKTAIYTQYCDKKEDGTPDIKDERYHFQTEDLDSVNSELLTLLAEEVDIPVGNAEKIKELVEKTNYSPKPGETEIIDGFIAKLA